MMTKGGGEVWVHPKNEEVQINLSLLIAWTVDICSTALGALRSLAVSAPEISCAIPVSLHDGEPANIISKTVRSSIMCAIKM